MELLGRVELPVEVWAPEKLIAADGTAQDQLGWSVAVSGDTAVLGAYHTYINGLQRQGTAYVFERIDGQWRLQQKLLGSDSRERDQFGWAVAVSGDTVLIGANTDDVSQVREQGSAFVFVRQDGQWTEQQKLLAPDGAASDYFGQAVALSGDTALVGANLADIAPGGDEGAVYVFVRSGTTWALEQKLSASDGASMDNFGQAVALSGDTALVGAYAADVGASAEQGAAYVFGRSGTSFTEQQKLVASDGVAGDALGWSVALSTDTAVVGAYLVDVGSHSDQGAAYVFGRSGASFSEQGRLTAAEGAALDGFGWSVTVSGDTVLVGANKALVGTNVEQGAAFMFGRSGSTWAEQRRFVAQDGAAYDGFGWSVAAGPKLVLAGTRGADVGANTEQGVVYAFAQATVDGDPCAANGDCASHQCADGVCCDVPCTGACAACSVAAGATADGVCTIAPAATVGSPACAPLTCNGVALDCVGCAHDAECASGTYCAADGTCQEPPPEPPPEPRPEPSSEPPPPAGCACRSATPRSTPFGARTLASLGLLAALRRRIGQRGRRAASAGPGSPRR